MTRGLTTALGLLEGEIRAATPCAAVGLVVPGSHGTLRFEIRNRQTASAIFVQPDTVPAELRLPIDAPRQRSPIGGQIVPGRAIERFLTVFALDAVCAVPVPIDGGGLLFGAIEAARAFTDAEIAALDGFARRLASSAAEPEPIEVWERRSLRLDDLAAMLPVLGTALDVRAIFDHLSTIAGRVLPHDFAIVGLYADGGRRVRLHAISSPPGITVPEIVDNPYPEAFDEGWAFAIHRDLASHPLERDRAATKFGMGSAVRVGIRDGAGRVVGVLSLASFASDAYGDDDLAIAMRIGDYITLALSHQQQADEARRAAEVRERAANLEMLEQLLETLSGVLDIREVFGRVSAIAHKVLPHDAMAIAITLEDPPRLRVHALSGFAGMAESFETPMPEPELLTSSWDHRLMDFGDDARYAGSPTVQAGMRSVLCVPVRFDGRLHAAVNFYARAKGAFSDADIAVARRITDHITLAFSHQRLVEEAQRTVELRSSAASLEMLDELLAAQTHAGDLDEVFDRVAAIAQKAIPHDMLLLPVALPDGRHARIHARGTAADAYPEIMAIPDAIAAQSGSEYDLVDDLQRQPLARYTDAARRGYRSVLRVPVRLEDRYAGALIFFARATGRYTPGDVMAARRIADRVTLVLARDRGAEAVKRAEEATARAARLEARVRALTEELDARTGFRRVVGESPTWRQVLLQATRVAATDTTVLLLGESGTGKEVIARFLHRASERSGGPFVALNCAALPEHLLEAELFGYERGAFTGATQSKPGQLEQAAGGTLFLDEVGEMSLPAQAKFLRVLQEREFQRLGGTRVLRAAARIVAATNRDLRKAMEQSTFREDLFYRLNVFAIRLPPLRERRDDILPLTDAFLAEIGRGLGRPPTGIARDARAKLLEYHWPGNVRELRNILERAAILCDGGEIAADHLALTVAPPPTPLAANPPIAVSAPSAAPAPAAPETPATAGDLKSMERTLIEQALQSARFNKSKAAKTLGLTRAQLYVRMRRHGLE